MKKIFTGLMLWLLCFTVMAQTPYFFYFKNSDGSAKTNIAQIQVWPPTSQFFVYGTNLVDGSEILLTTNINPTTGYFTNVLYANTYRVLYTNVVPNVGFFLNVPDTTTFTNAALYATNLLVVNSSNLNAWGGVRGLATDTSLEFLSGGVHVAGSLAVFTNTSGGVSYITISNSTTLPVANVVGEWASTNISGFMQPSNEVWATYATNGLSAGYASTPLFTNTSGGYMAGTVYVSGTSTSTASNNIVLSVVSTNEAGAWTNTFSVTNLAIGQLFSAAKEIVLSNTTKVTFLTTTTSNSTYDLRLGFRPWIMQ